MKMTFEEFDKMVGTKPAKIEAKADKKGNGTILLEGRGLELMGLSMQIAEDVMKKTNTDVDSYCEILKEAINGKNDDSKATEESKEKSKLITKEQFEKAWKKVITDILDDEDLSFDSKFKFSMVSTKCADNMCVFLFGEGLKDE